MFHPECPSPIISILQNKINPVIIGAARYALRCYEMADDKDLGFRQCTNFTLGCAFYDSCSERLRQLSREGDGAFKYELLNDLQQLIVFFEGKEYLFFTGRVHALTRQLLGGKGKKRYLDEQYDASWLSLPGITERNVPNGMFVIGADFSSRNGLGRITLDYHVPISKGEYDVFTITTLHDSDTPVAKFSSTKEKASKPALVKKSPAKTTEKKAQVKKNAKVAKIAT
jgi:hypothetical protein